MHRSRAPPGCRTTGELAFYLCWSPAQVPLSELVRVAGIRWSVEECFQAAKGQIGLDHYQVRNWTSWHRHRHLLAAAFHPPALSVAKLLRWSTWRRHHQATARRSHCRRRATDEPAG